MDLSLHLAILFKKTEGLQSGCGTVGWYTKPWEVDILSQRGEVHSNVRPADVRGAVSPNTQTMHPCELPRAEQ